MSRVTVGLRRAYHRVFGGLLGTPVLYILGGALLGALAVPISANLGGVPDLATVEVARSALPTIGGATLSLAGFVLTITTLSLQFGASTYSPRLVEHLRRDRLLGHTLGAALGTFSYSVVVLLAVRTSHPTAATVATLVAVAGATADVLLFIALLERLIDSLRPGRVLSRQMSKALALAESAYPEEDGDGTRAAEDGTGRLPDDSVVEWDGLGTAGVLWREGPAGHIVDLHAGALTSAACEHDALVTLTLPVGAFVQTREALAVVRDAGSGLSRPADPDLEARVLKAISVGDERTVDADPAYPLRLVVDIGLRALSPGINDPTTAAQAIDHVEQILLALSRRRLGMQTLRDADGVTRVQVPTPGWPDLVRLGYVELVAAGRDPQTRNALARSTARLASRVAAHRRAEVRDVAALLDRSPDAVG